MDMEEKKTLPEQAQEHAKNYFRQGLNCSECVMQTFLDLHGSALPKEIVCLATGFGGGIIGRRFYRIVSDAGRLARRSGV